MMRNDEGSATLSRWMIVSRRQDIMVNAMSSSAVLSRIMRDDDSLVVWQWPLSKSMKRSLIKLMLRTAPILPISPQCLTARRLLQLRQNIQESLQKLHVIAARNTYKGRWPWESINKKRHPDWALEDMIGFPQPENKLETGKAMKWRSGVQKSLHGDLSVQGNL